MTQITNKSQTSASAAHLPAVLGAFAILLLPIAAGTLRAEQTVDDGLSTKVEASVSPAQKAKELTKLGDRFFEGVETKQDFAVSAEYYRQAADLGDPKAMMRYGEALVLGRGTAADVPTGIVLLRKAGDLGNTSALLLLADVLGRGAAGVRARAEAVNLYERAADLGRSVAFLKLAQVYSKGAIIPADSDKAVSYYRKAIAAGREDAIVALGAAYVERKLGREGTRAEGLALLEEARRMGHPDAVVYLSEYAFNGNGVRRNPAKALAMLREAWDGGNVKAGVRLLAVYRDGRKNAIKKDRFLAEYYFRRLSNKLSADDVKVQRILLNVSQANGEDELEAIRKDISNIAGTSRPPVVRKIRSINANAYVYLVQSRLTELNLYQGPANGQLSRKTAKAILRYCASMSETEKCRKGPLTAEAAETMSTAF